MSVTLILLALVLVMAVTGVTVWRRRGPSRPEVARHARTWKERGEARGRTTRPAPGRVHAAGAEPEATVHIKVIRADGTVEDHGTIPAIRTD